MIKKSVIWFIAMLVLIPAMLSVVSAADNDVSDVLIVSADPVPQETIPPVSSVDHFTRNGLVNGRSECLLENGIKKAYLNYNDHVVGHGNASDESGLLGVQASLDNNKPDNAACDDGICNNALEKWHTQDFVLYFNMAEGWHNLSARATDKNGNTGTFDTCMFCVDKQTPVTPSKPVAQSGECALNYINQDKVSFSWEDGDNGCAGVSFFDVFVEIERDGETTSENKISSESSIQITGLKNKDQVRIKVRANDKAGNTGEWSDFSDWMNIDLGIPTVKLNSPNASEWLSKNFDIDETDFDAEGNLLRCEFRLINGENSSDWEEVKCNSILNIDISKYCPQDGLCTFYKKVTDKACNVDSASENFKVDSHAPVTTKIISEPKYTGFKWMDKIIDYFITDKTEITFTCSDGNGIGCDKTFYRTKLENIDWSDWLVFNGTSLKFAEDGVYFIEYSSEDLLKNVENNNQEIDKVDTEAPTSTKTESPYYVDNKENKWVSASTNFTITAKDEEVGVNKTFYEVDGDGFLEYASPFNLENKCQDENILHLINYYSIDHLSNQEAVKNQTVALDCEGPAIDIRNPTSTKLEIQNCAQSVFAKINDNGVGVDKEGVWAELWDENGDKSKIIKNQSMIQVPEEPDAYSVYPLMDLQLPAGNYTLKVIARDKIGNINVKTRPIILKSNINDIRVESTSSPCLIDINKGGQCNFTFDTCIRGGNSIKFWLGKLGDDVALPYYNLAKIFKGNNSANVRLLDDAFMDNKPGFLLKLKDETINGRESFTLSLNISAEIAKGIGMGPHKLDYQIRLYKE